MVQRKKRKWWMKKRWIGLAIFLLIYTAVVTYHQYKPLPEGVSYESKYYEVEDIQFYRDLTYTLNQKQVVDQEIFDRIGQMIESSEEFIVIDMFMMNGLVKEEGKFPPLSDNLMNKLILKKENHPEMEIVFITDHVNTGYSSYEGEWLEPMRQAGIDIVFTELNPLRDPTPLYSGLWRMGAQWFGQEGDGSVRNAFVPDGPKMTVRSYLQLMNVKANHRKMIITDESAMISSGNAHDESGFHSNVAFEVSGPIIQDMLNAEQAVINLSEHQFTLPKYNGANDSKGDLTIQYVTEGKTWTQILETLNDAQSEDEIWLAMFYLADRSVVEGLTDAANRGANVFLLLDPNETAFGNDKTGLPNRPVVNEIIENTNGFVQVRWYNVTEEQFHPKMMLVKNQDKATIISGSANFTKRNLVDYNLESNLIVRGPIDEEVMQEVDGYFSTLWNNDGGSYTVGVTEYQDTLSFWQRGIYALQKFFGFTTY
ncbi:phospholipase D family protein [Jeotgalibacillus soli]|uniref:phospholipase D n=1 Tax=Jeotgalibacillus soli TaxID=889306 RepID=A0A0C2VL74_9BACL|nr:phospholipase D family protein [Jeotgalibacillus soli]KIL45211.1 hypothetical protein KP78_27550 [Jeotgalibacillus soli]